MKYLVTGATGFIGSTFIRFLRTETPRAEITGVSLDGKGSEDIDYARLDLTDMRRTAEEVRRIAPDRIFHLAGAPRANDWELLMAANVKTTVSVLEAASGLEGAKAFVIGSAAEYGMPERLPVTEGMEPRPMTKYAVSMACRRMVVRGFAAMGCHVTEGILFNPIGKGINREHAPGAFAKQIDDIAEGRAKPPLLTGNLRTKRDFVDMDDACRAFLAICEKGKDGEAYNICSGESRSIGELLELIMKGKGAKLKTAEDPARMRGSEVPDIYGSLEKVRKDTGWSPKINFEESVKRMLANP